MSIAIVLADDHLVVRRGLRAVLETEPDLRVVGEAPDGASVLPIIERERPDVLVLDLLMPNQGGLQVLQTLNTLRHGVRVVVLSIYSSEAYVTEALRLGALGYVVKDASASDLVAAVRHAAAGRRFLSAPLSDTLIDAYTQRVNAAAADPYERLTPREREVLVLTADGFTSGQIAARLNIGIRTVESHRANLSQKLGIHNQSELIRFAIRRGLLDPHA